MPNKFDLSAWQEEHEIEMEKRTACKDCQHFRDEGAFPFEKRCGAEPMLSFDPLRGQYNAAGFKSVYEINIDGACKKYAEKK